MTRGSTHCSLLLIALVTTACAGAPAPASPGPAAPAPSTPATDTAEPAAGARCSAIAAPAAGLPAWMVGHWVQKDSGASETWVAAGPALLGVGFVTPEDGPSWFEVLIITEVGGVLTYTALPMVQRSVDFPLVEAGADSVLFANPAHDDPQKIRYQRSGETLSAEVDSTSRGKRQFHWQRATLATAAAPAVEIEEADRRFAADSAARGADAWAAAFAPDGKLWRRGQPDTTGPEAIRASMQRAFADPDTLLAWEPHTSAVAPAGDVGFTVGCYQSLRRQPGGTAMEEGAGTYLTIWRREDDGSWKAVFDTGIPAASPAR